LREFATYIAYKHASSLTRELSAITFYWSAKTGQWDGTYERHEEAAALARSMIVV
jgi:hypothetical protein